MKSILKKIGYWITFPFTLFVYFVRSLLESLGIIEPEKDDEWEDEDY